METFIVTIDGVSEAVTITATGTVVTGGSRLNLRTGAGMDYEIIDQLRPGEEVTVIGSEGDWYEVIVPEKKGFVHSDYLEIDENGGQNIEINADTLTKLMGILGLEFADGETSEDEKSSLAFTPDGNMTLIDDFLQIEALATEDTEADGKAIHYPAVQERQHLLHCYRPQRRYGKRVLYEPRGRS